MTIEELDQEAQELFNEKLKLEDLVEELRGRISGMKTEINETIKALYHDSMQYYNPHSEFGIGYADGILDVCSKLGVPCRKIDEGVLEFE